MGAPRRCPRTGGLGQACPPLAEAAPFLAAYFAKRNTKFGGGKARAGPEGETSFPYGVNKNSCFLLAP